MQAWEYRLEKYVGKFLAVFLAVFFVLSILPVAVHAEEEEEEDLTSLEAYRKMEAQVEEIQLWRSTVYKFAVTHPNYEPSYQFWWTNLDDDAEREMILVATDTSGPSGFSQTLFIYDAQEKDGEKTTVLLFSEAPPVPVRYGYSESKDGKQTIYNFMTAMYTGTFSVGTVKINADKTALEYTETNTYSMANGDSFPFETNDISGTYVHTDYQSSKWGPLKTSRKTLTDFELGKDNNSFSHAIANSDAGFYGLDVYQISTQQYAALVDGASFGQIGDINAKLNTPFGGACYGISSMMGLVKQGKLSVSDYQEGASDYFSLSAPKDNQTLYNEICTLYITQLLMDDEDYDCIVKNGLFGWTPMNLEAFIRAISMTHNQMLCYQTRDTGHAVLVKECILYPTLGFYDVVLYDMNSVGSSDADGDFYHLFVQEDFQSFVLYKGNDEVVSSDNFTQLQLISPETVLNKIDVNKHSEVEDLMGIFSVNAKCVLYNVKWGSEGKGIACQDGQVTGNTDEIMEKAGFVSQTADGTQSSYNRIAIPLADNYTITCDPAQEFDFSLNTGDNFYSVQATGVDTIEVSKENGLQLKGNDFTFTAGMTLVDNEQVVYTETTGSAKGTANISPVGNTLNVTSETPMHIDRFTSVQDGTPTPYSIDKQTTSLVWNNTGAPQVEVSMNWGLIIGIAAAIVVVGIGGFLIYKRRKKQPEA